LENALEPKPQERTTKEKTAVMADQKAGMKPDKEGPEAKEKTKPKTLKPATVTDIGRTTQLLNGGSKLGPHQLDMVHMLAVLRAKPHLVSPGGSS
jgi:hypothetical protein